MTIAEGHYDNFANPIWSNDGKWIVFNAPFDKGALWVTPLAKPRLHRLAFKNPPVPIADVSDLIP